MSRLQNLSADLAAFGIGSIATCVALALGLFVGGPLIRLVVGPPRGFGQDYTTWGGIVQTIIAQALFLVPVFTICGHVLKRLLAGRRSWIAALVISNPINVFVGYWLYYLVFYTGRDLHVELLYFRSFGAITWGLLCPILLTPAAIIGLRSKWHLN